MKRKILILALVLSLAAMTASAAQRPITRLDVSITTGAAVSGNLVLVGDSNGKFYAIDTQTGTIRWTVDVGGSSAVGIPAVDGNSAVFAQLEGQITCVRISDGETIWTYDPDQDVSTNADLSDGVIIADEKVFASFSSGELRAIDLKSGRVVWTYKAEQGLRTAPAYSNGLVLLGEYNSLFSMIDAKSGKRLNGGGAGGAVNTPTVHAGNVYYSAWDGSVHAVQIKDVIPLWNTNVDEPISTAPVIDDGIIVVSTSMGKIIALDEKNGSILWYYNSEGGDSSVKPSIRNGRVLAGTGDGKVIALNAKTGKLLHETPNAHALSTSGSSKLYYTSDSGLYVAE